MRTLIVLLLIMAGLIVSALFAHDYLVTSAEHMSEQLSALILAVKTERWESAQSQMEQIHTDWHKVRLIWNVFTEHEEIDDMNGTLARLAGFIEEKEVPSSLAEGRAALQLLKHIPEKESLTLINLL